MNSEPRVLPKPRIDKWWMGKWRCWGDLCGGIGGTPEEAYSNWVWAWTEYWT